MCVCACVRGCMSVYWFVGCVLRPITLVGYLMPNPVYTYITNIYD